MYNSYFRFSESPFENNLDQRFLFLSEDHKEVIAALSYFIKTKKGFAIVCGDVGTGKTMLINTFLSSLPEYVQPIIVANPGVSALELLRYIAKALNIEVKEQENILELTDTVKDVLQQAKTLKKQFVLIIDEAHLLSHQALEEIRLLSNIETQDQKLLQILLVGQYELSHKLDRPEMRHLRQRININRFLSPMNSLETKQYIDHRLKQVGASFRAVFEDNCASAIYKITRGVPRSINQLCDNALLICMGEIKRKVNRKILQTAQEALLTDRLFTPKYTKIKNFLRLDRFPRFLLWASLCAAFLFLVIVLSQAGSPGKKVPRQSRAAPALTAPAPDPKPASTPAAGKNKKVISKARSPKATSPAVTPKQETTPPKPRAKAVPPVVSPKTPGTSSLAPSPQAKTGKSASVVPEVEAATGGGTKKIPKSGKAKLPAPSRPARPAAKAEKPVARPEPVKKLPVHSMSYPQTSPRRWAVKHGDTLSIIASKVYNGSEKMGLDAVILNNPEIKNPDLIHPGQVVFLPWINPQRQTMRLRDNLFYAYFGRYDSRDALKEKTSLLEHQGIRYKIGAYYGSKKKPARRIILGGYATTDDLREALKLAHAGTR